MLLKYFQNDIKPVWECYSKYVWDIISYIFKILLEIFLGRYYNNLWGIITNVFGCYLNFSGILFKIFPGCFYNFWYGI